MIFKVFFMTIFISIWVGKRKKWNMLTRAPWPLLQWLGKCPYFLEYRKVRGDTETHEGFYGWIGRQYNTELTIMSFWLRQSWISQHCNLKNWIRLFLGSRLSRVFQVKRTSQKGGSSIRLQNKSQDSADPPHGHTLKRAMIALLHLLWWHLCLSQQLTPNPSSVNTAVTSAYLFVQSSKG